MLLLCTYKNTRLCLNHPSEMPETPELIFNMPPA